MIPYWTVLMEWGTRGKFKEGARTIMCDSHREADIAVREFLKTHEEGEPSRRATISGPFYREGFE